MFSHTHENIMGTRDKEGHDRDGITEGIRQDRVTFRKDTKRQVFLGQKTRRKEITFGRKREGKNSDRTKGCWKERKEAGSKN